MLRRILVAQLLTLFLDPQGAGPAELMEAFPEEFHAEQDAAERPPRTSFPSRAASVAWSVASEDLTEALEFLVDRRLVTIQRDGRVVPATAARPEAPLEPGTDPEREFSVAARDEAFATEPARAWIAEAPFDELGDVFGFDQPRLDA